MIHRRLSMHSALSTLTLLGIAFLPSQVLGATGRTPGNATVTDLGEAAYSIPITLPAGTNGMTPNLSLEYRHNSHGGLVGVGWSIGGRSEIRRCPRTLIQDGLVGPITGTSADRFCLDGVRLVVSNGGAYESASAEYRTEIESYSRVKRFGTYGSGPASFTVEGLDGLIREYGATTDSRTNYAWALNRIRDRSGNVIDFAYTVVNGGQRLSTVSYNSNPSQGIAASHVVTFVFENRPSNEVDLAYIAGTQIRQIVRLDRIDVSYQGSILKRYELTYEPYLSSAGHSRLASLQECGIGGTDCLSLTAFVWQNGTAALNSEQTFGAQFTYVDNRMALTDINGDGRADVVFAAPTSGSTLRYRLALSSGGFAAEVNTTHAVSNIRPFDYNGDGRMDLLTTWWSGLYGYWRIVPGTDTGLGAPIDTTVPVNLQVIDFRGADMNGDGLGDIVYSTVDYSSQNSLHVKVRLAQPGGGFVASDQIIYEQWHYYPDINQGGYFLGQPGQRVDLDGDGREDLLMDETYSIARISLTEYGIDYFDSGLGLRAVLDLNGDGCTDFLYGHSTQNWRVRFSGCVVAFGILPELIGPSSAGAQYAPVPFDWNADGKDDVLFRTTSGTWKVMVSTGDSLLPPVNTTIPTTGTHIGLRGDINGDSLDDLIAGTSGTAIGFRTHSGVKADLLLSATDGYGVAALFSYQPLTSAAVYTKGSLAVHPDRDVQDGRHVVVTFGQTDGSGTGSIATRSFTYEGNQANAHGRGNLGFSKKIATDHTLTYNQRTEEIFQQQFPFIGLTSTSVLKQASGQSIVDLTRTWNSLTFGSGYNARKFPYVASGQSKRFEVGGPYNGAHISTTNAVVAAIDSASGLVSDQTITTIEVGTGLNGGSSRTQRLLHPQILNDTTNWCLGRPQTTQSSASHTLTGGALVTRTESASWDGIGCRPTQHQIEPGSGSLQVTIGYAYDTFGNVASETVTGTGMSPRVTQFNWGARGQLPVSVTNALGHVSIQQWRDDLGLPTAITDPNGLATAWTYDAFGRPILRVRPDQTRTAWQWASCTDCGAITRIRLSQDEQNGAGATFLPSKFDFDQHERPFRAQSKAVNGEWTAMLTEFDARGRQSKRRVPYWYNIGVGGFALLGYDQLDRITSVGLYTSTGVLQQNTAHSFNGLSTSRTNSLAATDTQTFNAWGDTIRATDAATSNTNYQYNAFNQLMKVTDALGNVTSNISYNLRGMKTSQADLDMGTWIFTSNALVDCNG